MQVHQLMTKKFRALRPDDDLATALQLLVASQGRHLVVLDDKKLVGLVSEWDVLRAWARQGQRLTTAKQIMSGNVHTAKPSQSLADIAMRLIEERVGCFPVVEGDKVVGLVDVNDVIKAVARETKSTSVPKKPKAAAVRKAKVSGRARK